MTFTQQIIATVLGTVFGFVFALVLFYLTEKLKGKRERKNLLRNLRRELQYDLDLISKWIEELDKLLRKVSAQDLEVFAYLRYSDYQRLFINMCFARGILYDIVDNEHIAQLNTVLLHLNVNVEGFVNNSIQQWKKGEVEQTRILHVFEYERDQLQKFHSYTKRLLSAVPE